MQTRKVWVGPPQRMRLNAGHKPRSGGSGRPPRPPTCATASAPHSVENLSASPSGSNPPSASASRSRAAAAAAALECSSTARLDVKGQEREARVGSVQLACGAGAMQRLPHAVGRVLHQRPSGAHLTILK